MFLIPNTSTSNPSELIRYVNTHICPKCNNDSNNNNDK